MKIRVPISGTVGKSVQFDPEAGARAEAAVAALAAQISAGTGSNIRHSNLQGLQIGDDHPQYTGNAFPETITGQWNFQTIPLIQGDTLAEYIEDVVGGSFFDFLQDTSSVVWTFFDTANQLEANVPPEFVQDTVGAMLLDTTSIDLSYNDTTGTFSAAIIDEYVQDLVGAMLVDTATVDFTYNDALGQISAVVPGAALSKTDDTNVTLTLGGSPLTALARAASLTLGWTGTLAVPRGGSGAATLTGYLKGNGASAFTAVSTIPYSDISGTPTIPTGANPTASVGLAAVNGSAATFMRSDGAPALSVGIAPTWTDTHIWVDSKEIQLGTGSDLRLFHDGTNSTIRNDTGELKFLIGANAAIRISTGRDIGINCAPSGGSALRIQDDSANDTGMEFTRIGAAEMKMLAYNRNAGSYSTMDLDANDFNFLCSGNSRLQITAAGETGFNCTPVSTVAMRLQSPGFNDAGLELYRNSSSLFYIQAFNRAGSAYVTIDYNALSHQFDCSGTARATLAGAGTWRWNAYGAGTITSDASGNLTSVSDERLKRNIRPFYRGLDAVRGLRPILHGYTEASELDQSRDDYAGFSAQNVQSYIPEAVGLDGAGNLSLSDRPILAALVNALQELDKRITALCH